jgi:hypothetical protein
MTLMTEGVAMEAWIIVAIDLVALAVAWVLIVKKRSQDLKRR